MRRLFNALLCLIAGVCLYLLATQGFGFSMLHPLADLCLRMLAAACIQWLMLRVGKTTAVQLLPMMLSGLLAVWGFFLFLTSPSWQNATFWSCFADYASPILGCITVWSLCRKFRG